VTSQVRVIEQYFPVVLFVLKDFLKIVQFLLLFEMTSYENNETSIMTGAKAKRVATLTPEMTYKFKSIFKDKTHQESSIDLTSG